MSQITRRQMNQQMLASLTAFGLIETLFASDLIAASVKPTIDKWVNDLHTLCQDLKGQKLKDLDFQAKMEELYSQVSLPDLIALLDLDQVAKKTRLPDSGARSLGVDLSKVSGLPARVVFGKQIFGAKKGHSIVPHGHNNMCTGFIVLKGQFHGRHYQRVEDQKEIILIKPTIDRTFKPGEFSTISDHKDNVHWFKATTETAFVFNVHVLNYDPTLTAATGRVYLDPEGERTASGLIAARRMTSRECHSKFG